MPKIEVKDSRGRVIAYEVGEIGMWPSANLMEEIREHLATQTNQDRPGGQVKTTIVVSR